jgi:MFS family permease
VRERATRPFLILALAFFVLLVGSNLPTPLYAVYRERFGFSSAVLTLVFATYMVALVPTLLLCGQLSDRLGRRRVIAAGLLTAAVGLGLFAAAKDTAWLFVARAVQGVSVGMVTGAATAGLVELEPHGDRRRAALYAVLVQAGGSSAGPLLAGALAQWAPAPRSLCYLVVLVLALVGARRHARDPRARAGGRPLARPAPSVPQDIRVAFWRVSLTATTVWVVAALYLSVVPSYASKLLDTRNLAPLGAIAASLLATSCAAQILASRRDAAPGAQPLGLALAVVVGATALIAIAWQLATRRAIRRVPGVESVR